MSAFEKDDRGVERCQRVKETAIENVVGDASKGFHYVKAYCNRPALLSISDGRKFCPACDKPPVDPNARPRITNSAATKLTSAELKECGLTEDTSTKPQPLKPAVQNPVEVIQAVEAIVEIKKDAVAIEVSLAEIESGADIAALFILRVSEGMDKLPVTNFGESKRLIKLQEKLEALLGA